MADGTGEFDPYGFRIVRRGYDRVQVDEYIQRLQSGDESVGEPEFDLVRRGFECRQVDAYIEGLQRGFGR